MNKIKKLDDNTINLISAGEVIECPADIIKELVENSIDAKADNITLNVKNSGVDLIEIKDNGTGINKDDLEICLDKYTTSKINKIDDLYSINSFGFRGEALSTINAVSKLKIITSIDDSGKASILENNIIEDTSATKGTTIIVKDLFYNVPVRKKFLNSKNTEFSKIHNVFLSSVLKNPNIKFIFNSERKKEIFVKTTQEQRYLQVFGSDLKNKIINIDINNSLFKLKGIIGKPTNYFYYPQVFIFVNNRCVYIPKLQKIVTNCYRDYLMIQQKPFFVFFLEINPKTIDINVHPKKKIIKLENEILLYSEIEKEISKVITNFLESQNKINFNNNEKLFQTKFQNNSASNNNFSDSKIKSDYNSKSLANNNFNNHQYINNNTEINFSNIISNDLFFDNYKIISIKGQLFKTFILCECENHFLIIDQHAAAERINLEHNRISLNKQIDSQNLIQPKIISNLNEEQISFLEVNFNLMKEIGFEYILKENRVVLNSIPVFLKYYFEEPFFIDVINNLKTNPKENFNKVKDKIIKLVSCKSSIKANQELSLPEQKKLIIDLNQCKDKTICAHGRPAILVYSRKDLDKLFKRII